MKKTLAIILSVALVFSIMAIPTFAADESSSASTDPAPATSAPAAPKTSSGSSSSSTPVASTGATYTVKSGDVFWKIAQAHKLTIAELAALNPQVKNINLIYPGQVLNVKAAASSAPAVSSGKLYHGTAMVANYRVRNGNNDNLNVTTASVLFDANGKIVDIEWDVLEITPTMFPAWNDPNADAAAQAPYKDAHDGVWPWETKREKGDSYNMKSAAISGKNWWEQLDFYEEFFKGKTVAEVKAWVAKYTDPVVHKPYKLAYLDNEKITEADKAAAEEIKAKLTAEEIKMLVDVSSNATMSLQDYHSRFIDALERAYEYRKEVK